MCVERRTLALDKHNYNNHNHNSRGGNDREQNKEETGHEEYGDDSENDHGNDDEYCMNFVGKGTLGWQVECSRVCVGIAARQVIAEGSATRRRAKAKARVRTTARVAKGLQGRDIHGKGQGPQPLRLVRPAS